MDTVAPNEIEVAKHEEESLQFISATEDESPHESDSYSSEDNSSNEVEVSTSENEGDSSQTGDLSDFDDDDDSEKFNFEDDPQLDRARSSDENENHKDPDIVYEHILKHRSFFESAKSRRRRHLKNRLRGTVPALHFTGTKKTDFWKQYGVEPDKVIDDGNIHGIDTILTENEFKRLQPTERRIHINGQKFKVVHNEVSTDSLYRAVCQALGFMEREFEDVMMVCKFELQDKWELFSHDVCHFGVKSVPSINPQLCSPKIMLRRYRDMLQEIDFIPEFELRAAALHYGFTYAIVEINSCNQPINVVNCQDISVLKNGTVKYFFLKTSTPFICYEFLLPIGPLKKINDGQYPSVVRDVIIVESHKQRRSQDQMQMKERYKPPLGRVPVGLGLDHRVFLHRSTVTHDLWSLLAELMFKKLIHAPQIKTRVMESKHDFALYYLACKAKKRYQVYGNASIQKLAEDFSRRFSKENPRGDLEDLSQAAAYFDFSYTLIGLDSTGNFYWRDFVSQHDVRKENGPYLAFFVKTLSDKSVFWYALEDVGRSCPKERKLYKDVEAGDLSAWKGKFYFRYKPKNLIQPMGRKQSSQRLFSVPTQVIFRASRWASKSYAKLRSRFMISLSSAAFKTKSFMRSILDFINTMKSRRKVGVQPTSNKDVEALYVRENP